MKKDHCNDPHENLAWLDLETTGLRPNEDAILEIGIVITNKELDTVGEHAWVVRPSKSVPITEIDPYVFRMHDKNGLWAECFALDCGGDFGQALNEARDFVREHGAAGSPLCGSTINFDRGFLQAQAPELLRVFHYRNIDVSTLRTMFAMHFHSIERWSPAEDAKHRALDDLHNTIAEYRHYLDHAKGIL